VLDTACREELPLPAGATSAPRLAVNVSAHEFRRPGFLAQVAAILRGTGIDPGRLVLELTESAIIEDSEQAIASLWKLREMGVRIAIDDFGTGHSPLAYLRRLPIDTLKIDRSFVADCRRDERAGAIVAAVIWMAHSLGLTVVAEGVETAEQMEYLRAQGCDEMQGFLFSRPLPVAELGRFFAGGRPAQAPPETVKGRTTIASSSISGPPG
jgi:EAL domain-containing protein (putative c-di-GMP-specific phosphodiesterase class I)